MPSSIAFDFISIIAVASFATAFGVIGWWAANSLRLLELPRNPLLRFVVGLAVILLLHKLVGDQTQDQAFVHMGAIMAGIGFCLRSVMEFGVREHEADLAFHQALADQSMRGATMKKTNVVV